MGKVQFLNISFKYKLFSGKALGKVHLINYIHNPDFGLCQPHNNFKRPLQCSLDQSKLLHSSQLWIDYLKKN